jgi:CRP-like cAMP-binding protein
MPPGGGPPVIHRHDPSEIYYILEGEFTFYLGGGDSTPRQVIAGAGDVVPLPGGTPHTVRNQSDADAVAFVVHTPGPVVEGFTRAAGAIAIAGSPSRGCAVLAERHGSKCSVQSQLDAWLPVGGARSPEMSRRVLDC